MSQHIALLYIKNINLTETQRKEDKTMDIEMFGKLSDAFGPSGFEEEVHGNMCRKWMNTICIYSM